MQAQPFRALLLEQIHPDAVEILTAAGFAVEEVGVRARSNGKGPQHVIWFGTRR